MREYPRQTSFFTAPQSRLSETKGSSSGYAPYGPWGPSPSQGKPRECQGSHPSQEPPEPKEGLGETESTRRSKMVILQGRFPLIPSPLNSFPVISTGFRRTGGYLP